MLFYKAKRWINLIHQADVIKNNRRWNVMAKRRDIVARNAANATASDHDNGIQASNASSSASRPDSHPVGAPDNVHSVYGLEIAAQRRRELPRARAMQGLRMATMVASAGEQVAEEHAANSMV